MFPLWPVYGLPMLLLKWLWIEQGNDGDISPIAVFWTLRVLMFSLSFVLEDWALHELIPSARHRKLAVILVASSYVSWTYQTHTFSNSIETLAVVWSLVLIQRIVGNKVADSSLCIGNQSNNHYRSGALQWLLQLFSHRSWSLGSSTALLSRPSFLYPDFV